MNNSYFDSNEARDMSYLRNFNDRKGWFTIVAPRAKYSHTDAMALDTKGREWDIELKGRECKFDEFSRNIKNEEGKIFDGFLIEEHKLNEMIAGKRPNCPMVYWNFFDNGERCWFILAEDIQRLVDEGTIKKRMYNNIYSKGYQHKEKGPRYNIPFRYGRFYHYNKVKDMWDEGLF